MTCAGPLVEALRQTHKVTVRSAYGCSFSAEAVDNADASALSRCAARNEETVALINSEQPDEIYVAHTYEPRHRASDGSTFSPSEWSTSVSTQLGKVTGSRPNFFVLTAPPASSDITSCYGPMSVPSECVSYASGE